jgi:hypothetical protein
MRFIRGSCQLLEAAMTLASKNQFFDQGFHTVAVPAN